MRPGALFALRPAADLTMLILNMAFVWFQVLFNIF